MEKSVEEQFTGHLSKLIGSLKAHPEQQNAHGLMAELFVPDAEGNPKRYQVQLHLISDPQLIVKPGLVYHTQAQSVETVMIPKRDN